MSEETEIIKTVTGFDMPVALTPEFNYQRFDDIVAFTISELTEAWVHQGGVQQCVFDSVHYRLQSDFQIHRVVEYPNGVLHYRVCKAYPGSGYEAFMVGAFTFTTADNHASVLAENVSKSEIICK